MQTVSSPSPGAPRPAPTLALDRMSLALADAGVAMPRGLMVFDSDARVRAHNPAAAQLLTAHSALELTPLRGVPGGAKRLTGTDAALRAQIEQAVHECASSMQPISVPGIGMEPTRPVRTLQLRRSAEGPGVVMHLSPLGEPIRRLHGANAAVLCSLTELGRREQLDFSCLVDLFDLSTSSARVAEAYLRADTVKDVARQLGISANTVKTHLATVYERTGCSRQSQLIRLLMALSAREPG